MRLAIHFDCQSCIAAEEVDDIRPGGMLSPKFESVGTLSKPMPENHFWQRHLASKLARALRRARSCLGGNILQHDPSTVLRTVPLPETSSGRIYSSASRLRACA